VNPLINSGHAVIARRDRTGRGGHDEGREKGKIERIEKGRNGRLPNVAEFSLFSPNLATSDLQHQPF